MPSTIATPSIWLIFYQQQLIAKIQPDFQLPCTSDIFDCRQCLIREHLIAHLDGTDIYCAELTDPTHLPHDFQSISLRSAVDHVDEQWYLLAAKAFSIINWDRNHQFCGRCGQATLQSAQTFERVCPNCQLNFYPRISPSVIVLITKGDQILMARSPSFPPGVYALIAGFVEPGESIEDAVHREVYEETRLKIKNLRYFGSQPWPFPDSLMMGFFAEYESGELQIDTRELEDAGWYDKDKLPGRPSFKKSIASQLLNAYLSS